MKAVSKIDQGAYQHLAQLDKSDHWARSSITLGEQKNHLLAQAIGYEFLAENAACRGEWDESYRLTRKNRELAGKMGALNRQAWSEYPRIAALWNMGLLTKLTKLPTQHWSCVSK